MTRVAWTRRRFMSAAAKTGAVAAVSGLAIACSGKPGTPVADEPADLSQHAVLTQMAFLLFPFPDVDPAVYGRVADAALAAADGDIATEGLINGGIVSLAGADWLAASTDEQIDALEAIEDTAFFGFMMFTTKTQVFNDRTVWAHIGYDPSAPLNDIDWLGDE